MRKLHPAARFGRHVRGNLLAYLALFFALGGTSFAAVQMLPANSVGTKQLKNGAVTKSKIAPGTIAALHGARGKIGARGARGATGAAGPQGPTGATGATGLTGPPGVGLDRPGFAETSLGTVGASGSGISTSVAVGSDGLGIVSFYDAVNHDLKVAHCSNVGCTSFGVSTVDSVGDVGRGSSVAVGADGLPLISYFDLTNHAIKLAHCSNAACTAATTPMTVSVESGTTNLVTSIVFSPNGTPLIAASWRYPHLGGATSDGKVDLIHCAYATCTSHSLQLVASAGTDSSFVAPSVSLTIGVDSLPLLVFFTAGTAPMFNDRGVYAVHCTSLACTASNSYMLSPQFGPVSVTVGSDGFPVATFQDGGGAGTLALYHCDAGDCSAGTKHDIASGLGGGDDTSATVGRDGLVLVSERNSNGTLDVIHCSTVSCATATPARFAPQLSATSATIGADGLALISGYDAVAQVVRVVHCSNLLCIPYYQRR